MTPDEVKQWLDEKAETAYERFRLPLAELILKPSEWVAFARSVPPVFRFTRPDAKLPELLFPESHAVVINSGSEA